MGYVRFVSEAGFVVVQEWEYRTVVIMDQISWKESSRRCVQVMGSQALFDSIVGEFDDNLPNEDNGDITEVGKSNTRPTYVLTRQILHDPHYFDVMC